MLHLGPGVRLYTPWQASPLRFEGTRFLKDKRAAFATDLDETYYGWVGGSRKSGQIAKPDALQAQNAVLAKHAEQLAVIFNTSNSLKDMKKRAHLLEKMPLDVLILENGKKIFFNDKQRPPRQWVEGLRESAQDREWRRTVENISNWNLAAAKQVILETILSEGYTQGPSGPSGRLSSGEVVRFEFLPTHAAFDLIVDYPPGATREVGQREADRLAAKVVDALEADGMLLEANGFDFASGPNRQGPGQSHTYVKDFGPRGVNKGSALQYVVKKMPALQGVVSAGDNELNDLQALERPYYLARRGVRLPAFPIAVGQRPLFLQRMATHPRVVSAEEGNLASAIETQLSRLRLLA